MTYKTEGRRRRERLSREKKESRRFERKRGHVKG